MIIPITSISMIEKCLPLIEKVDDLAYNPKDYLDYIKNAIQTDFAIALIDIKDNNEIDALVFAETIISITDREVLLNLAYVNPSSNGLGKELWDMLEKWAKMKECKRICCITKPVKARAMIRKYGFQHNWAYLTKELIYEG